MIEFAPNPSGPAHLGTLRTYAVAWVEARRLDMPLIVRFDAQEMDHLTISEKWKQSFLDELRELDMQPDGWEYLSEKIELGAIPDWAEVVEQENCDLACYPKPMRRKKLPSAYCALWIAGQDVPREWYGGLPEEITFNSFAVRNHGEDKWVLQPWIPRVMRMHLRGARYVVRALNVSFVRPFLEQPAKRWFGFKLPQQIMTSMVVADNGGLRKTHLKPDDVGTISWAINEIGAGKLRDRVISSASDPGASPIISVSQLLNI